MLQQFQKYTKEANSVAGFLWNKQPVLNSILSGIWVLCNGIYDEVFVFLAVVS